jgi:aminopeptidase N
MKRILLSLVFFYILPAALLAQVGVVLRGARLDSAQRALVENEKQSYRALVEDGAMGSLGASVATGNFHVYFYRCEWQVDPNIRAIAGKVTSYFTITSPTSSITYDLSDTLAVDSITWHGAPLSFQRPGNDGLVLQFPSTLASNYKDSVSIYYKGVPRQNIPNGGFRIFSVGGLPTLWTLSEPYGAKEWWPCKNVLTEKTDSTDFLITCPAAYRGTSNGVLMSDQVNGANRTTYFKHRYPIASYLVAFAVTDYQQIIDSVQIGSRMMPVLCNYFPGYYYNFLPAVTAAKVLLPLFSKLFGDYPFAKEHYSQTQAHIAGGMEHQTNTFTGSAWDQLVGHELGHQWFGDKVTCGSWHDIWLNEGFGNYMQFLVVQNLDTSIISAHLQYYIATATATPGGSVYVDDTTSVSRVFSGQLTYAKGGYVLHMLRGILGDSVFFAGIRSYLNDPQLQYNFAKTADLERHLELVSGKDLSTFFQKWIYGQGYPKYNATWSQNNNGWVRLQLSQTTSHSSVSFYEMPVQLKFMNARGDTALVTVDHRQSGQVFWLNPGFTPDSVAIDPNFWILTPVKVSKKIPAPSTVTNDIRIYPNPAPTHVYISLFNPVSSHLSIRLYNAVGQEVYKQEKNLSGQDELIDIPTGGLAKGTYIIRVSDNKDLNLVKKLVK